MTRVQPGPDPSDITSVRTEPAQPAAGAPQLVYVDEAGWPVDASGNPLPTPRRVAADTPQPGYITQLPDGQIVDPDGIPCDENGIPLDAQRVVPLEPVQRHPAKHATQPVYTDADGYPVDQYGNPVGGDDPSDEDPAGQQHRRRPSYAYRGGSGNTDKGKPSDAKRSHSPSHGGKVTKFSKPDYLILIGFVDGTCQDLNLRILRPTAGVALDDTLGSGIRIGSPDWPPAKRLSDRSTRLGASVFRLCTGWSREWDGCVVDLKDGIAMFDDTDDLAHYRASQGGGGSLSGSDTGTSNPRGNEPK